jgi:hypothetical protein
MPAATAIAAMTDSPRSNHSARRPNRVPRSPKNSPYNAPNTMLNAAHGPAISETVRMSDPGRERWCNHIPSRARTIPYPMSPSIMPKNIGKKTATNGVGSMDPYAGSGSTRTMASKGRKSRGLCRTTGASSAAQASRASSSTARASPTRSRSMSRSSPLFENGSHPSSEGPGVTPTRRRARDSSGSLGVASTGYLATAGVTEVPTILLYDGEFAGIASGVPAWRAPPR